MNINEKIIQKIISQKPQSKAKFDDVRRKVCGQLKIQQPSNRDLLKAYHNLVKKKSIKADQQLEYFMRKADIRTLSGIAVVTSLTKQYKCPGNCLYCPTEAKMPKSYLATEPAAARALALQFNPYQQMQKRIEMLQKSGHPTDKIEFIIKGGTWNAYPLKYQYWFILESFKACNNLSRHKPKPTIEQLNNGTMEQYEKDLRDEQNYNEKTKHRIIGLTLETRPDAVTPETIYHMRQQGCTRIELGLQAPDDKILKLIKRGHTFQQFKDAILLLRQAGFKVDLHFMPDLPGTTAKHDVEMYKLLFSDLGLKPDMVKIYPCTVIKSAELYKWFKNKKYKPYSEKKLFEALIKMKTSTPQYCRISRLIRDIPDTDIQAGNRITNLREELKREMKKRKLKCKCLRCREIGHQNTLALEHLSTEAPVLFVDKYETVGGTEYFISFEDKKREIVFGFLRLRLPVCHCEPLPKSGRSNLVDYEIATSPLGAPRNDSLDQLYKNLPEIKNSTFIRELHVYGQLVNIGKKNTKASQHKGLGKKLVKEAEKITKKHGFEKLAVISGVGVRDYYRKLGYKKTGTYMMKKLV